MKMKKEMKYLKLKNHLNIMKIFQKIISYNIFPKREGYDENPYDDGVINSIIILSDPKNIANPNNNIKILTQSINKIFIKKKKMKIKVNIIILNYMVRII